MMERYEIEKLRSLPCEGVAQRLGMMVKRHKALCPFHNDHTPSMTFKGSKFKCWSCGESGDSISLVMKYLNKDFKEACRWLADENNIILANCTAEPTPLCTFDATRYEKYFEHPWLSPEARKFLFEERRLDERVVRWCRLTSWKDRSGTPWLEIPYFDRQGKLIGVQNRNLIKGATPRFRFPQGGGCISLYNQPVLNMLRPGDTLYICEGASDTWSMLSSGYKAIAIPSATLLSQKDKELLQTLDSSPNGGRLGGGFTFHMFPDRDEPGERLFLQLQKVLPTLVHHQLPPDCKDFSDYYLKLKRD